MTLPPSTRRWMRIAAAAILAAGLGPGARFDAGAPAAASDAPAFRIQRNGVRLQFQKGRSATIPIDVRQHGLWTRGSINGTDSVSIVFDTGADSDCIRDVRAQSIGLALSRTHQAHGAGGTVPSSVTERLTLGMPGLELRGDRLSTLPLEELGAQIGRDLDVIVGHPLFGQAVVAIDYEHGSMDVIDPKGWEYRGNGVVVPLTFEDRLPYVTAKLTLPGREPVEGRFVLDTGSAAALILSSEFIQKHRVLDAIPKTVQGASRGVGGQVLNPVGRVARLEIGGIALERPVTIFRSPGPGSISAAGSIGNIGGGILRRFKVIFDYPRSRLILEPNPKIAEPFEYDMSGLGLRTAGGEHRRFVIARVLDDSPAAELGLRVGDEILSVNGRAVTDVGLPSLREMLRRDGEEHRFVLLREGAKLDVTLRTRRLL